MGKFIRAYAARGIQIQPLAGFHGRLPSTAEAQNLRRWALRFGPRGAFWKGRSDGHLAIRNIEFGNETSYPYQYGESGRFWLLPSYAARARDYALRVKDAALALQGTGVGLLVQGEDGGSGSSAWIDHMFAAVPELSRYVAAWTVHPYGPGGYVKIDRMLSYLAGRGAPASTRFSITEWGLSSDNGRTLSNNYGYATNMTYDEAAATLREVIGLWRGAYGARVAQLLLYQHADQRAPGHSTDREHYFGVLKKDGSDKGTYTAEVRALIGASPAPS